MTFRLGYVKLIEKSVSNRAGSTFTERAMMGTSKYVVKGVASFRLTTLTTTEPRFRVDYDTGEIPRATIQAAFDSIKTDHILVDIYIDDHEMEGFAVVALPMGANKVNMKSAKKAFAAALTEKLEEAPSTADKTT